MVVTGVIKVLTALKNVKRTILDQTATKDATMRVWTAIKQQGYVIVDVPRVGKEHFVVKFVIMVIMVWGVFKNVARFVKRHVTVTMCLDIVMMVVKADGRDLTV